MWKWLKGSQVSTEIQTGETTDTTLMRRALAAGLNTITGHRRSRVLHAYAQSASSSVAGMRAMVASGVPVDSLNHDGDTAFLIAVRKGREPLARVLIELGANVNHQNRARRTALHEAAQQGAMNLVRMCLTFRARLDLQDVNGNTPLHLAAARTHVDVVEFLIRAGSRPDTVNRAGQTSFAMAHEPLQRKMTTWWLETSTRLPPRR
ncbi:MAG TPA: ankyrin repeat domain-containing protein [Gammaproteobacteria bacterium]